MPQVRNYGFPLDIGSEAYGHTGVAPIPAEAIAPITIRRHARNGKVVQVEFANRLREAADYAAIYRSKQVLGLMGFDGYNAASNSDLPAGSGRPVVRWAFHTGPMAHALRVRAVVYPPTGAANQTKLVVKIYSDAAMTTLAGSADLCYGPKPVGTSFGWRMVRDLTAWIDGINADTDYYGEVWTVENAKLGGLCVHEMQSLTENGGYLANNLTMHSPVLATDRSDVHTMLKNQWKRGGSHVLNWSIYSAGSIGAFMNEDSNGYLDNQKFVTTASTTSVNMFDRTSTAPSSSTPGYTLDLRFKDRISQSGVPCVMAVYGRATDDGIVSLVNSSGTTVVTVSVVAIECADDAVIVECRMKAPSGLGGRCVAPAPGTIIRARPMPRESQRFRLHRALAEHERRQQRVRGG